MATTFCTSQELDHSIKIKHITSVGYSEFVTLAASEVESNRGKKKLTDNGFQYVFDKRSRDGVKTEATSLTIII